MGLNDTPTANRIHIGFFGCRNAGKSSVVNAITGQKLTIVSEVLGTTTDPVMKAMELLPLGPVMIIDTPGFDDEGELGQLRIKKTTEILNRTDIAILVIDAVHGESQTDLQLKHIFKEKNIPYLVVKNKMDLLQGDFLMTNPPEEDEIYVSARTKEGILRCKEKIGTMLSQDTKTLPIVGDLLQPSDFVLLVVPIDEAAPKGRLILPQQQTIRDILEVGGTAIVVKDTELEETLQNLGKKPAMVITDSQVFEAVSQKVPEDIPLTSFSILMARYKGYLETALKGVNAIEKLKDGDCVLISEGCSHHRQCGDIGSVKIPSWLKKHTGKELKIELSSGRDFPENLSPYSLIIHCGGCMLNEREVKHRMTSAVNQGIPFTNYGITIAYMKGILERSISGIYPG